MLNAVTHGTATSRPTLLIVHGLFGSARNWGGVARRLSANRHVVAVDMRNHGDSPKHDAHTYPEMAADLEAVIEGLGGRPVDLMGHSMGGKAAMALALTQPNLVRRLVVVDMAPKPYGHSQIRYVEAMDAMDLTAVRRRADADVMLSGAVEEPELRAFLLQSLAIAEGVATWKLNLTALAAQMHEIMGFPSIEASFDGPALFLSGDQSDYVGPHDHPRIEALFPRASFEVIAGAGHWVHAEQPEAFVDLVGQFLDAETKA